MVRAVIPSIRILDGGDAEAFHALRLHGLRSAPEAFHSSYEEDRKLSIDEVRRRLDDRPNAAFGAFANDVLVGIAAFGMNTKVKQGHKGLLWTVFVDPEWRGHSLGKRLTETVIDYARLHVDTLHATVMATSVSARALYLGLGFTVFGFEKDAVRVNRQSYDDEHLRLDLR